MPDSHIHICLIQPENYSPSLAFSEIQQLLKVSFASLNIPTSHGINRLDASARFNIILGYHLLPWSSALASLPYIIYQLEPWADLPATYRENALKLLRSAKAIWDYSHENIHALSKDNLNASLVPPGYHPQMEVIKHHPTISSNALFYGTLTDRRKHILNSLSRDQIPLQVLENCYGAPRDLALQNCSFALNIHAWDHSPFEAIRLSHLITNRIPFITETSTSTPYPKLSFISSSPKNLSSTIKANLNNIEFLHTTTDQLYETFKREYCMTRILQSTGIDWPCHIK